MRNALGSWKTLIDGTNNVIRWQHIVDLYEYQKNNGFTLANKLTKQHVNFEKNPMKVKYAVQVLSQSVANALLTMSELKHEKFQNIDATVEYLKTFDSVYDIMNSRSLQDKVGKAAVQEKTTAYICSLKSNTGKPVLQSERYATFLGVDILNNSRKSSLVRIQ